jgi:hypothetical protein
MPKLGLDLRKRSEHASRMVDVATCSCPHCGEVDVPIGAILLSETDENEGGYGFKCPGCRDGVWKEDPTGTSIALLALFGAEDIQTIAGATPPG